MQKASPGGRRFSERWKVVEATAVGGIPTQVIYKLPGLLAYSAEGAAYQIRLLLSHREIAARLAQQGHQHVKKNLLIANNSKRYLTLFLTLANSSKN